MHAGAGATVLSDSGYQARITCRANWTGTPATSKEAGRNDVALTVSRIPRGGVVTLQ